MDDYHQLSGKIDKITHDVAKTNENFSELAQTSSEQCHELNDLQERMSKLFSRVGEEMPEIEDDIDTVIDNINHTLFFNNEQKTNADKTFELNRVDVLVACIAGGMAVLIDFLVVRVPKDMSFTNNGNTTHHEGSPLTKIFREIGIDENGNEAKWIRMFEKWFHVGYDKSTGEKGSGMYPKNHRVFSLAHDPSIIGLIWGIHDIVRGTFSYIGKDGVLHIEKITQADLTNIFYAPFMWLGHIVSDIFTKQGIPIPGMCVLRMLKAGNLGDKDRTVGELVEYMYVQGYDLRHLVTMSTCRLTIDVVIKLYSFLIAERKDNATEPRFEQEYVNIKKEEKERKMMFLAYSIAVAGNIGKVVSYQGSPFAINAAVWYQFAREAISQYIIYTNESKYYIKTIENRHLIDENFERLLQAIK